jgi:hypothetical protein
MGTLASRAACLLRRAVVGGGRALWSLVSGPDAPHPAPDATEGSGTGAVDEAGNRCGERTLWLRITRSEVRLRGTTRM